MREIEHNFVSLYFFISLYSKYDFKNTRLLAVLKLSYPFWLKNAVLGKLGPRPGPVVLLPGGYRASGRLDRAGYPAWPLYTLITGASQHL